MKLPLPSVLLTKVPSSTTPASLLIYIVTKYRGILQEGHLTFDSLAWWNENKSAFPRLSILARVPSPVFPCFVPLPRTRAPSHA